MDYILLTTGFLVPQNSYFNLLRKEDNYIKELFNRSQGKIINNEILNFFKENEVYTSSTINNVYKNYIENKNFDNFISLVNIATDIFKNISFIEFIKVQMTNKHISPISISFCLDLVENKFIEKHTSYYMIPANIKFSLNNGLTKDKILENIKKAEKGDIFGYIENWENILSNLMINKEAFETFFKYIFVDQITH